MRLFLAQSATLYDYGTLQARFSAALTGRWRPESSLHATVLFLGQRFAQEEVIAAVSAAVPPLEGADVIGVERFGHNRIFYGAAAHPSLCRAHADLSRRFGMTPHPVYTPHVTLMRYKRLDETAYETARQQIEGVILGRIEGPLLLMRSTLTPQGAVYDVLHQF